MKVFIAYSRKDIEFLEEFKSNLNVLLRTNVVDQIWFDGMIEIGHEWEKSIKHALLNSDLILLLISSDFISSDYCYETEMKQALKLHSLGKAKVVPIIIRDCLWQNTPFGNLQALPKSGGAIANNTQKKRDKLFTEITKEIELFVKNKIIKNKDFEFYTFLQNGRNAYNSNDFIDSIINIEKAFRMKYPEEWKIYEDSYRILNTLDIRASPLARIQAKKFEIDIRLVKGSKEGRIIKEDVDKFVEENKLIKRIDN